MPAVRALRSVLVIASLAAALATGLAVVLATAHTGIPVPCDKRSLVSAIAADTKGADAPTRAPFGMCTLTGAHGSAPDSPAELSPLTSPITRAGPWTALTRAPSAPAFRVAVSLVAGPVTADPAISGIHPGGGSASPPAGSATGDTVTGSGGGVRENPGAEPLPASHARGNAPDDCAPPGSPPKRAG
ncbi:hypothetical protein [Streptomyces sp. NBC_00872]|uniref:hypothetical protein n=1 Tax=Streptomyces sp. NBC_00872 TaxID=2903686 RepID=UPI00386AF69C|nr:hypothetical protein OG214_38280 [Streptomyces sp. NBC_00872]